MSIYYEHHGIFMVEPTFLMPVLSIFPVTQSILRICFSFAGDVTIKPQRRRIPLDDKLQNELALFKFSLIAPIVNGSSTEPVKDYLEKVCAKTYEIPGKGPRELSPNTIRRWLFEYRRYGIDGLKRKPRNDKGSSRVLTGDIIRAIREFRQLYPKKTVSALYAELLAGGFLGSPPVSLSTVGRYLKKIDVQTEPDRDATITLFRKVYEVPQEFIGRQVTVQYDPEDLSRVFLKDLQSPKPVTVYPVRPVDNSKIIRKQNVRQEIDFASLFGGGNS